MPLENLGGEYTFKTFLERLKAHCMNTNEEIRILAYISDLSPQELFEAMKRFGFVLTKFGSIVEVKATEPNLEKKESSSIYYLHYNYEKNLLLCFTSETLDDASRIMDRFVNQQYKISQLWIHPLAFDKIRKRIIDENPNTIINEFNVKRYHREGEHVIREKYQRSFRYFADDGRYTLDEICKAYGVLPTSLQFIVPEIAKFRLTDMGRFTFVNGDLDFLFDIINDILTNILFTKSIIDKAKIEFIPVNMGKKELRLPKIIPLDITFSREIDFSEIEQMVTNMSGEAFNFEIFDMALIPGSIHLSGTVLDKNKNISFNLTGNSKKVTLSPRQETNFDSMLQFYKMVTEKLDLNASIQVPPSGQ